MFRVYFNRRKQWLEVELWDVHPNTFEKWGAGRWAYFQADWEYPDRGKFGELHFVRSRIRFDVIGHELFHVMAEWIHANRTGITSNNEERLASLFDEMCRKLEKELRKQKIKL